MEEVEPDEMGAYVEVYRYRTDNNALVITIDANSPMIIHSGRIY